MNLLRLEVACIKINKQRICDNFNLTIAPGKIWGILGPNGCGKTTFLHTLVGLRPMTSGQILLQERALHTFTRKTIAKNIGLLFQDFPVLFPQTVGDYCLGSRYPHLTRLQLISQKDREIAQLALHAMQLDAFAHRDISTLSGGEKRRLALAGLLSQNPQLYLLDEPTNHLDVRQQIHVLKHFHQLVKNMNVSVIMVMHDINLAYEFCDSILMLLPDGETLHGATETMLTSESLSRLYQYPMLKMVHNNKAYFKIRTANDD